MRKFKIVVRGGYGLTNFGDDALLQSIHRDYLDDYSNSELGYSCTYADYLKNDIGDYEILPLNSNYSDLTDILIYGGGTQFYSFNNEQTFFEKTFSKMTLLFKPKKLIQSIAFKLKHVFYSEKQKDDEKVLSMALGIGLGPFLDVSNPQKELKTKQLFEKMSFVAVRDIYSLKKCKEWNLQNYAMYADLCFKMKHSKFFPNKTNKNIEKVGVIVRDWNNTKKGKSYRLNLIQTVDAIRKSGKDVTFIIFAKDKDPSWLKTLKRNNEKILLWDPDIFSIRTFFDELSVFDIFITARYHGAVFSAMLGKPFITIEVEQKLTMISELFSDSSYNWSYPFFKLDLIKALNKIELNYEDFSSKTVSIALKQKQLAEKMKFDLDLAIKKTY